MFNLSIIGARETEPKLANDRKKTLADRNNLEGILISLKAQGQLVGAGRGERGKSFSNKGFQVRLVGLEGACVINLSVYPFAPA